MKNSITNIDLIHRQIMYKYLRYFQDIFYFKYLNNDTIVFKKI